MKSEELIHLYWYNFDSGQLSSPVNPDLLDDLEMAQYAAIEQPERADHFAYRHSVLRQLLSLYCDLPAKELMFDIGRNGKPSLAGKNSNIHFNTSQSKNAGVIAICTTGPVGVDVEFIRDIDVATFAQKILSAKERIDLSTLTPEQKMPTLFKFWTAKEALIKALGIGLNLNQLPQISLAGCSETNARVGWQSFELAGSLASQPQWYLATRSLPSDFHQAAIVSIASQRKLPVSIRSAREVLTG